LVVIKKQLGISEQLLNKLYKKLQSLVSPHLNISSVPGESRDTSAGLINLFEMKALRKR
jgi:hypothetical protein